MALQPSQSLRKRGRAVAFLDSVFAGRFFKKITVLVINCSGNIHMNEIIFHFNCAIMVVDRLGKSFQFWKLQGENVFQIFQVAVIAVS